MSTAKSRSIQAAAKMQTESLLAAGAKPTSKGVYKYVLQTEAGEIYVTPYGDWVACFLANGSAARSQFGISSSPNGKCNFHETNTRAGESAFLGFLDKVKAGAAKTQTVLPDLRDGANSPLVNVRNRRAPTELARSEAPRA